MSVIPRLETDRLILREPVLGDYDDYAAMWREPEVLRFTQRVAPPPELMWSRFLRNAGFWRHLGFGLFTVEEKATGRFVGQVGFFDARREIEPSLIGLPEAGWTLGSSFHGKGYGFEATEALIAWGGRELPGRRAVAIIDVGNVASRGLAERLGFAAVMETDYQGHRLTLLERWL